MDEFCIPVSIDEDDEEQQHPLKVVGEWLEYNKIAHKPNIDIGLMSLVIDGRFGQYSASYCWDEGAHLLQFIVLWEQEVSVKRQCSLSRLLELINRALTFGHFIYYPPRGVVFHASIPVLGRQLAEAEVKYLLEAGSKTIDAHYPLFAQWLAGQQPDKILAQREFLLTPIEAWTQ